MAENHLGGAASDIDHQPPLQVGSVGVRQHVCHALVNKPSFFATWNDVDAEPENGASAQQELIAVAGFSKCLCRDSTHLRALETGQAFAEAGQRVPSALHGLRRQVTGAVEAVALSHGLLQVFGSVNLAVIELSDFEPEAVGAEIDGGEASSVLHVTLMVIGTRDVTVTSFDCHINVTLAF